MTRDSSGQRRPAAGIAAADPSRRRPGAVRRFLPEIALVTVMVALAIGLRAIALIR